MGATSVYDYYESFCNYWKNNLLEFDDAVTVFTRSGLPNNFRRDGLITYVKRREAFKQENKLYDFPDMLSSVIENDIRPTNLKVLFVDEAQDDFPLLWEVIKMWVKDADRVYLCADPYQCIYNFSGADPSLFIDFPADKTMTLKQSHRCPREVHDLSRKVVNRFKLRYDDDDFMPRDADGSITRKIGFDLTDEPTFWLFRTRYLLNKTYDDLYAKGIPFITRKGKVNIFNHRMDKKRRAVNSLLSLRNSSISLADLVNIIDYIPSKLGDTTLIEKGSKKRIHEEIEFFPDEDVSWWDLRNLGFTYEFTKNKGTSLLEFLRTKDFPNREKSYIRKIVDKYGISVLWEKPKLELGTFHSVKGDEATRVIIDPSYTRKPYKNYIDGNDEEHRLIYTAITRSSWDVVILPPSKSISYPI